MESPKLPFAEKGWWWWSWKVSKKEEEPREVLWMEREIVGVTEEDENVEDDVLVTPESEHPKEGEILIILPVELNWAHLFSL